MGEYAKEQMKRKVSQFILSEAGRVGYRNAFSMAALVTASSLAAMMLSAHSAKADIVECGNTTCDNNVFEYCCVTLGQGAYFCTNSPYSGDQPMSCWHI